jgi:hypothetical protein
VRSPVNVVPRDAFGVPNLRLGIVMQHLPPKLADVLASPLIALTIGDVRNVGLRKLPYGPNTQIARDRHVPLLDIGTMDQIKAGNIVVHSDIDHFTETGVSFSDGLSVDVFLSTPVDRPGSRACISVGCMSRRQECFARSVSNRGGSPPTSRVDRRASDSRCRDQQATFLFVWDALRVVLVPAKVAVISHFPGLGRVKLVVKCPAVVRTRCFVATFLYVLPCLRSSVTATFTPGAAGLTVPSTDSLRRCRFAVTEVFVDSFFT